MTGARDSIVTSAQRPEVKLAEAEFALRGLRRELAPARRLTAVLVVVIGLAMVLLGALAWALALAWAG